MKIPKKIGLLSIDIDSIDYWVLKEINEIDQLLSFVNLILSSVKKRN